LSNTANFCSVLNLFGNYTANIMNNDGELLHQYAFENSQTAFGELVRRHLDLVYSVALRKVGGDDHAARDVAQAVFIALARNGRSLSARSTLAGWLYVTSQHQAAQWVRSERRRQNREHEAHTMNENFNTPEIDWHQLRPVLDETLQELSEPEREAILLRYFEMRPLADVGRALLVSEDAARMRVDRAVEKLRTRLARRGISSTAAVLATALGHQVMAAPAGLIASITQGVAAAPAATATTTFMNSAKLLIGGLGVAAIATAVILSREPSGSKPQTLQSPNVPQSPLQFSAPKPSAAPTTMREVVTNPVTNHAITEEREPREPVDVRRAEFERKLASYRPLLEKLSFTAEQRQTFETLLATNLQRQGDLGEFARTQGARPIDPDVNSLGDQADAELAAQIRTTFGDSVYAAFEHFNETGAMRELVYHLTKALVASHDPLNTAKSGQLVEILANHSRGTDGRISGDPRALNIEAVVSDARQILTPTQIATLRQVHEAKH
jgi:RNA polymerase sigma factor (sigma-70 family)